jgi:hypothetical protein
MVAFVLACGSGPAEPERQTWGGIAQHAGGVEGEREAAGAPPSVRAVRVEPTEPMPGDRVRAIVEVDDPDGRGFVIGYTWSVGGREIGRGASGIDLPEDARAGEPVEVTVVVSDGSIEGEPFTASAAVGNRRPRLARLDFETSSNLVPGDTIVAVPEAFDADDDSLEFEYEWTVNREPLELDSWSPQDRIPTDALGSGDVVQVTVVARDHRGARSLPLTSRSLTLGDAPPEILSAPSGWEDGTFRYAVEARDPQGGALRFGLRTGPDGMRVDPMRGVVEWRPAPGQAGTHPVEIVVENRSGARAIQAFDVEVSLEVAAGGGR